MYNNQLRGIVGDSMRVFLSLASIAKQKAAEWEHGALPALFLMCA